MADNILVNGYNIASNDIAGVYYQRYKLIDGRAGQTAGIPGTADGGLWVDHRSFGSAVSCVSVAASVTSVTLKAANVGNRRKLCITNTSTVAWLFVRCAATATSAAFEAPIAPNFGHWEMPFNYDGIVTGIWSAADAVGKAIVSEYT